MWRFWVKNWSDCRMYPFSIRGLASSLTKIPPSFCSRVRQSLPYSWITTLPCFWAGFHRDPTSLLIRRSSFSFFRGPNGVKIVICPYAFRSSVPNVLEVLFSLSFWRDCWDVLNAILEVFLVWATISWLWVFCSFLHVSQRLLVDCLHSWRFLRGSLSFSEVDVIFLNFRLGLDSAPFRPLTLLRAILKITLSTFLLWEIAALWVALFSLFLLIMPL